MYQGTAVFKPKLQYIPIMLEGGFHRDALFKITVNYPEQHKPVPNQHF